MVDEVSEVLEITDSEIEPSLLIGASTCPEFISGMGKVGGKVLILLDIDKVLSSGELTELSEITDSVSV